MPRYILTHKRAKKRTAADLRSSRKELEAAIKKIPRAMIHDHLEPEEASGRRTIVLDAEPHEIAALKKKLGPGLLIEREIQHKLHASPARSPRGEQGLTRVEVRGGGGPLDAARITLLYEDGGALNSLPYAFTGIDGRAELRYDSSVDPVFVIAEPDGDFWAMFNGRPTGLVRFTCPSLPRKGPMEWWHRVLGMTTYDKDRGRGIRVAVVGTGVGPHPRLRHVVLTDKKPDIERHETHVCGIIAARPVGAGEFAGIAPGSSVFSVRIFRKGPGGDPIPEHQGAIAHAIERMARSVKEKGFAADLINLSFGSPEPSRVLRDAIQWAFEQGTLCICSAGNSSGGSVEYPAAFRETVAVTALGKTGWGPAGSTGTYWIPDEPDKFGKRDLYLAGMSSIGSGVGCAAPGNGIISTIPRPRRRIRGATPNPAPYAAMDGTSLASPMVCGALAALLSDLPAYQALPRTAKRARMAREVLRKHCTSIGLKPEYEGMGLPAVG